MLISDYEFLLNKLGEDWLSLELKHHCSKSSTNDFWRLAIESLPKVLEAKRLEDIDKHVPQFRSIRQNLHDKYVPRIFMEVAYEVKETGDVILLQDLESSPIKKFPPSKFRKLYETAHVKVG